MGPGPPFLYSPSSLLHHSLLLLFVLYSTLVVVPAEAATPIFSLCPTPPTVTVASPPTLHMPTQCNVMYLSRLSIKGRLSIIANLTELSRVGAQLGANGSCFAAVYVNFSSFAEGAELVVIGTNRLSGGASCNITVVLDHLVMANATLMFVSVDLATAPLLPWATTAFVALSAVTGLTTNLSFIVPSTSAAMRALKATRYMSLVDPAVTPLFMVGGFSLDGPGSTFLIQDSTFACDLRDRNFNNVSVTPMCSGAMMGFGGPITILNGARRVERNTTYQAFAIRVPSTTMDVTGWYLAAEYRIANSGAWVVTNVTVTAAMDGSGQAAAVWFYSTAPYNVLDGSCLLWSNINGTASGPNSSFGFYEFVTGAAITLKNNSARIWANSTFNVTGSVAIGMYRYRLLTSLLVANQSMELLLGVKVTTTATASSAIGYQDLAQQSSLTTYRDGSGVALMGCEISTTGHGAHGVQITPGTLLLQQSSIILIASTRILVNSLTPSYTVIGYGIAISPHNLTVTSSSHAAVVNSIVTVTSADPAPEAYGIWITCFLSLSSFSTVLVSRTTITVTALNSNTPAAFGMLFAFAGGNTARVSVSSVIQVSDCNVTVAGALNVAARSFQWPLAALAVESTSTIAFLRSAVSVDGGSMQLDWWYGSNEMQPPLFIDASSLLYADNNVKFGTGTMSGSISVACFASTAGPNFASKLGAVSSVSTLVFDSNSFSMLLVTESSGGFPISTSAIVYTDSTGATSQTTPFVYYRNASDTLLTTASLIGPATFQGTTSFNVFGADLEPSATAASPIGTQITNNLGPASWASSGLASLALGICAHISAGICGLGAGSGSSPITAYLANSRCTCSCSGASAPPAGTFSAIDAVSCYPMLNWPVVMNFVKNWTLQTATLNSASFNIPPLQLLLPAAAKSHTRSKSQENSQTRSAALPTPSTPSQSPSESSSSSQSNTPWKPRRPRTRSTISSTASTSTPHTKTLMHARRSASANRTAHTLSNLSLRLSSTLSSSLSFATSDFGTMTKSNVSSRSHTESMLPHGGGQGPSTVVTITASTGVAIAVVSGISGGGVTIASQVGRMGGVQSVVGCLATGGSSGSAPSTSLSVANHPTQLSISSVGAAAAGYAGCVLGNIALGIAGLGLWAAALFAGRSDSTLIFGGDAVTTRVVLWLSWLGSFIVTFLLQATASAAVSVIFVASGGGTLLGVLGVLWVLAIIGATIVIAWSFLRHRFFARESPHATNAQGLPLHRNCMVRLLEQRVEWWLNDKGSSEAALARYGVLFEQYRDGMIGFLAVELGLNAVLGFADSFTQVVNCAWAAYATIVLLVVYLALLGWLRPYNTEANSIILAALTVMQLVAVVMAINGESSAADELVMIVTILSSVYAIKDVGGAVVAETRRRARLKRADFYAQQAQLHIEQTESQVQRDLDEALLGERTSDATFDADPIMVLPELESDVVVAAAPTEASPPPEVVPMPRTLQPAPPRLSRFDAFLIDAPPTEATIPLRRGHDEHGPSTEPDDTRLDEILSLL